MAPIEKTSFATDEGTLSFYLKEISKYPTLTMEQEKALAVRIKQGDVKALHLLIRANLRFVVSVARNYQNQGIGLCDLINEGNLGLIRAASRYDENKEIKFISYAVWWIRQSILQAMAQQSRLVKLPVNRVITLHRIGRTQGKLEQKFQRAPTESEVAKQLDLREDVVRETLTIANSHSSLDAPIKTSKDMTMMDTIRHEDEEYPDRSILQASLEKMVSNTLDKLSRRERKIVCLYFGIGEDTAHTLDEIGEKYNLTRERVRQIKQKAIEKLKRGVLCSRLIEEIRQ